MWWLYSFVNIFVKNSVVLSLLPLICNHGSLTVKVHQKK